jgi:hypothetical protein
MKRILTLLAAALLTTCLSGVAFSEELKKDETAAKEVKIEKKDVKKNKKAVKKEVKKDVKKVGDKEEVKPSKKKKEAAGC